MDKSPPTVTLLIGCMGTSGRQRVSGIFDYIRTHAPHWATMLTSIDQKTLPFSGCIVDQQHAGEIARLVRERIPFVAVDVNPELLPRSRTLISSLGVDNREITKAAAAHFKSIGPFRGYVYVHDPDKSAWSIKRARYFRSYVARKGVKYAELPNPSHDDYRGLLRLLSDHLKPVAVFCANDRCASNVLVACKSAGLKVPAEIAVLGVDNDTFICDYSDPSLSSVEPNFEREGYLAAKELDRLLSKPRKAARRIPLIPVKGIVTRSSTRPSYSVDVLVQTGLDFINSNFHTGITVLSVSRAMGVSRRLAELRFRQIKGTSIGAAIVAARIQHAQHLLKTTKLTVGEIARDCGFSSSSYMTRTFKKQTGHTPREWSNRRALSNNN